MHKHKKVLLQRKNSMYRKHFHMLQKLNAYEYFQKHEKTSTPKLLKNFRLAEKFCQKEIFYK